MKMPFFVYRLRANVAAEFLDKSESNSNKVSDFILSKMGASRLFSQGFTLLELLVVMVIIGLLASYVGPKYFGQIVKSEVKVARAQIDALEKALAQYRLDMGRLPTTEMGLAALVKKPVNETKWSGPYLTKDVPLDPWGKSYVYKCCPGDHGDYDLYSLGKDGVQGGSGEGADITNWSS